MPFNTYRLNLVHVLDVKWYMHVHTCIFKINKAIFIIAMKYFKQLDKPNFILLDTLCECVKCEHTLKHLKIFQTH